MVSTRVCGTLGLGSNPSRHPITKTPEKGCFCFGVPKQMNCFICVWGFEDLELGF